MNRRTIAVAIAMAGALVGASSTALYAQGEAGPKETYVGRFVSTSAACPSLDFHLVRTGANKLQGMAFDPMMSGQMSSISGDIGADGKVHLTMNAMGGKGGSGAINGTMQNGNLALSETGGACPMMKLTLMPVQHMFDAHG
jgi:hypothetical protein